MITKQKHGYAIQFRHAPEFNSWRATRHAAESYAASVKARIARHATLPDDWQDFRQARESMHGDAVREYLRS